MQSFRKKKGGGMAGYPDHAHYRKKIIWTGWIIGAVWTATVAAHHIQTVIEARSYEQEHALKAARTSVAKDIIIRKWIASHGGVYVPTTEKTPPNPYLLNIPDRDIITPQGVRLTLMNPAYAMRQIFEFSNDPAGISTKITSLKLMNPINAPDEWERNALETLERQKDGRDAESVKSMEVTEFTIADGNPCLRLIKPLIIEKGCLKCHGHQNYGSSAN
jgi:hypothetical protein